MFALCFDLYQLALIYTGLVDDSQVILSWALRSVYSAAKLLRLAAKGTLPAGMKVLGQGRTCNLACLDLIAWVIRKLEGYVGSTAYYTPFSETVIELGLQILVILSRVTT